MTVSDETGSECTANLIRHARKGHEDALRLLRLVVARAAEDGPPDALLRLADALAEWEAEGEAAAEGYEWN
jgi:hypothetical protein